MKWMGIRWRLRWRKLGREGLLAVRAICGDSVSVQLLPIRKADEALVVDEARERAHREGAATEAEAPDAIVILIVAAQKLVELDGVLLDANAECEPQQPQRLQRRCADAVAKRRHLIHAGEIQRFVEPPDIRLVRSRCTVPGAVGEHNQIAHKSLRRGVWGVGTAASAVEDRARSVGAQSSSLPRSNSSVVPRSTGQQHFSPDCQKDHNLPDLAIYD